MTFGGRLSTLILGSLLAVLAAGCGTVPPPAGGADPAQQIDRGDGSPIVSQPASDPAPASDPNPASDPKPGKPVVPVSRPALVTLRVTAVAGPPLLRAGASGSQVRDLQARLKQLAWFSGSITDTYGPATTRAVAGFQDKRGLPATGAVDQQTLDRLRAMTRTPTSDELHNRLPKPSATGLDPRCSVGRVLCISKRTNSLVWLIDGKAQARFDVRFGSYETPTREGRFSVGWKSRNHVSTIYHTPMPYAMFFSGGQAVHYSADFAARGYNGASHGCVNVRNLAGIQALFDQVRVGDTVIVYR